MVNFVGFIASCSAFILFIPQAVNVWRMRKDERALRGVSILTNIVLLFNACCWGLYGFLTSAFWVAAPGLVSGPLAIIMIILISKARKQAQ